MSSGGRLTRGKSRLVERESFIKEEKAINKRIGRVNPEDTIKIPVIGEWNIGAGKEQEKAEKSKNSPSKKIKPFPKNVPLNDIQISNLLENPSNLQSEEPIKKPKKIVDPPMKIKLPHMLKAPKHYERKVAFPEGTATTDLSAILRSKNHSLKKPLPPLHSDSELGESEFLPLEYFDDDQLSEYTIEELLKNPHAVSQYTKNGETTWEPCTAINFNNDTQMFTIKWDSNHKKKHVPRFNIRFDIENLKKFENRIEKAKRTRLLFQAAVRLEARLALMPIDNLPGIPDESWKIIMDQVGEVNEKYLPILQEMEKEIRHDYKAISNKMEFLYDIEHNNLIPNRDEFLLLIKEKQKLVPHSGLSFSMHYNFNDILQTIILNHLFANKYIQEGLFHLWNIFQIKSETTFLINHFPKALPLDEFITKQYQYLADTTKEVKDSVEKTIDSTVANFIQNQSKEKSNSTTNNEVFQKMAILMARMLHTVIYQIVSQTLDGYEYLFSKYLKEESKEKPLFFIDVYFKDLVTLETMPAIEVFEDQLISILEQFKTTVSELPVLKSSKVKIDTSSVSFTDCTSKIEERTSKLSEELKQLYDKMKNFINDNKYLEEIMIIDPVSYVNDFDTDGERKIDEYREQIDKFQDILKKVMRELKTSYCIGLFKVHCKAFKESAVNQIRCIIYNFLSKMKKLMMTAIEQLHNEYEEIIKNVSKTPETPEDLANLILYLDRAQENESEREKKLKIANQRFAFLEENQFDLENDEFSFRYDTLQMPAKVVQMMSETDHILSQERIRMIRELRINQRRLENDSIAISESLKDFTEKYQDLELTIEASDQINEIGDNLQELKDEQDKYNSHEKLFDFDPVNSRILAKVNEEFLPLHSLWNLAKEWILIYNQWMNTPFPQVRADSINTFVQASIKKIAKLKKDFLTQKQIVENVLTPLSNQVEEFKKRLPLLIKLRHPGVKTKHWEIISKIVGFVVKPTLELTLQEFLEYNLDQWYEKISEIVGIAAQEFTVESNVDQMDAELQTIKFVVVQYKDTEHYILQQIDDILSVLDDQIVTTQALLTSPFILPIKRRTVERLDFLKTAHQTIDEWIIAQRNFLYLQPIFTGTSIQQKLHKEAVDWQTVNKVWGDLMKLTFDHPEFFSVMSRDRLFSQLQTCNKLLDLIIKGLNEYLESKRLSFPRFFFLSNEELISILSHTHDFTKIQDSMPKLFEYVNSITVTEQLEIIEMNDAIGEVVKLMNSVDGDTAEIEDWLLSFEEEMRNTMKQYIKEAVATHSTKKKEEWISDYPAQSILIANQILWTQHVTTAFKNQKSQGIQSLLSKYLEQLNLLTDIVRNSTNKLVIQVISCLLIAEVHNRDILNFLVKNNVHDPYDFKWQQQLRYYWEDETVFVRSINNSFEYTYEYAGNSARLVITPLTDRCYQTLLAAFKQNLSGAPSGPAGTGKTETVRDCAKALGRSCVVYNCSENVTPEQMSQFFAGLSTAGSWSCFDEFNRINIEVLSVIAQQVRTIQNAISSHADTFKMDKRTLKLNPNAAICITMNPGYAGRTELPDNLKALFRPCAMMIPDYGFICEILLFSGGFQTASDLSVKMVSFFKLCRTQLSNQHHYDWGMRAIKSILSRAAIVKRSNSDLEESVLLMNSIHECIAPRLVMEDIPLYQGILHDVFPCTHINKPTNDQFVDKLKSVIKSKLGLIPLQETINKAIEFYETQSLRHGIMLVGNSMSMKSTAWKAVELALNYDYDENGGEKKAYSRHLNPKAITLSELYGNFNPATSEWTDGILSSIIRECSFSEDRCLKFIIVDGPVDSTWIESMNSLLDDNKVLCLPNNERIQFGALAKMVFEVGDLIHASPATVSRCGMIFCDQKSLPWTALADAWVEKNSKFNNDGILYLRQLMNQYIPPLIKFLSNDVKTAIDISPNFVVKNFLNLLDCYIPLSRKLEVETTEGTNETTFVDKLDKSLYVSKFSGTGSHSIPVFKDEQIGLVFERGFIFSLVWSFGGILPDESRKAFDLFFKDQCESNKSNCSFPQKLTVFDYYADFSTLSWSPWSDGISNIDFSKDNPIYQQMIPAPESAALLYLSQILLRNNKNILVFGPESSKSLLATILSKNVPEMSSFDKNYFSISTCTTPDTIMEFMRSLMHKKGGKYGPMPGKKLLFLYDNMNSYKPEEYGAQPPLELIRQFHDYGGWYNLKSPAMEFMNIVETYIYGMMGQPGGGYFPIPDRLSRHYFLLHVPKYKDSTLQFIMNNLLMQNFGNFLQPLRDMFRIISNATIELFGMVNSTMLPTPSKLHYVFGLRNVVRVLRGMHLANPQDVTDENQFMKLWYHEMNKEFLDKFNTEKDRKWFSSQINSVFEKHFKAKWEYVNPGNFLMFNKFSNGTQKYQEITAPPDKVLSNCVSILEQHNQDGSKELKITLFNEAVEHISALVRVTGMQKGHMLLLGVKSSGRKSFAHLASYIAGCEVFSIQIKKGYSVNDWKEDIKNLLKQCGTGDTETCFIVHDGQILFLQQLEDIASLMSSGYIPLLFENDEIEAIKQDILQTELNNEIDPFEIFIERIVKNLHIIFVLSPYGNVFKDVMIHFPTIRNESVIDFYMPWSQNALVSIANATLNDGTFDSSDTVDSIVTSCVDIHKSVELWSSKYLKETKRFTAVTPSRYFELLSTFVQKYVKNLEETNQKIKDYESGVEKIKVTRAQIEELSIQLDREIPLLEKTRSEVKGLLDQLKDKRKDAEKMKRKVEDQSRNAEKESIAANEANQIAQEQLDLAKPLFLEAQEAVQKLDKDSLVNIKKLHAPSAGMKGTFEAICIMFGRQPRKIEISPGVKEDDYWPEAVTLLNDVQFIRNVTNFKIENITSDIIHKLKKYVPEEKPQRHEKRKAAYASFSAVGALYDWLCASFDYWFVYQDILPKKRAAEEAEKRLETAQKQLKDAQVELEVIESKLKGLMDNYNVMQNKEKELELSVEKTQIRLGRAQKIMSGLLGESKRWTECARNLKKNSKYIIGDTLLITGSLVYLGAFTSSYRTEIISQWKTFLKNNDIDFSSEFSIESSLGNDVQIRDWILKGLPNDQHSIENALIITQHTKSFPLLIDPQLNGTRWLRAVEGDNLVVLQFDQSNFITEMRRCVSTGLSVLIDNIGMSLDPSIDPILSHEIVKIGNQMQMAIGGELVAYNENFRLYLSTKYPNPRYTPEICSQLTLINFATTMDGLSDLLLNNLLEVEREDLDRKRISIMESNAENFKKLKEAENEILRIVSNAGDDILDDDNAVQTLQNAQKTSASIEQQMAAFEKTELLIQQFKSQFQSVAERAALLYFCVADFGTIDPMYQFSLKWFVPLFRAAIADTSHSNDQAQTIEALNQSIAKAFYTSVSHSLFSRHKLLFSALMTFRILISEKKITNAELAFFISPTTTFDKKEVDYISDDEWKFLSALPKINPHLSKLINHMKSNKPQWMHYLESEKPEQMTLPFLGVTPFQKMLILRIFHVERIREGLSNFIKDNLGEDFIKPPTLNLSKIFKDSDCLSPLVFIIMPGIDPQDEINQVAQSMGLDRYLRSFSLGRGQGQAAEDLITDAASRGFWVLLQNCHLSLSWMPRLEQIITNLSPQNTHQRFRLCLVTMSSPDFPIGILYQSTKLIYEIPKGIRENVMRIYNQLDDEEYNEIPSHTPERPLLFQLAYLHGIILERLQFGPLGWNIPYEFNPSDFNIALKHLRLFLSESEPDDIPFEAINYVIGELDYGGRVTDNWDRRTLLSLLVKYFNNHENSLKTRYPPPSFSSKLDSVIKVIEEWPVQTLSKDVSLSDNATAINSRNEALRFFANMIELQPNLVLSSDVNVSEEEISLKLIQSLKGEIPTSFNIYEISNKFDMKETLNTILMHEVTSYNKLIDVMKSTLDQMTKGINGLIIIDNKLENFLRSIKANKVPQEWLKASYPSILSLHSYMEDFKKRIAFFTKWIRAGCSPVIFKLGAFFHPDEFLNGVMQMYSRKHNVAYDSLSWITTPVANVTEDSLSLPPQEGVYIAGLPIEGAKWDYEKQCLIDCTFKELKNNLPVIHMLPTQKTDVYDKETTYECPVYRTQNRGTGALDLPNYIVSLFLPTPTIKPEHWILCSVAAFITTE